MNHLTTSLLVILLALCATAYRSEGHGYKEEKHHHVPRPRGHHHAPHPHPAPTPNTDELLELENAPDLAMPLTMAQEVAALTNAINDLKNQTAALTTRRTNIANDQILIKHAKAVWDQRKLTIDLKIDALKKRSDYTGWRSRAITHKLANLDVQTARLTLKTTAIDTVVLNLQRQLNAITPPTTTTTVPTAVATTATTTATTTTPGVTTPVVTATTLPNGNPITGVPLPQIPGVNYYYYYPTANGLAPLPVGGTFPGLATAPPPFPTGNPVYTQVNPVLPFTNAAGLPLTSNGFIAGPGNIPAVPPAYGFINPAMTYV